MAVLWISLPCLREGLHQSWKCSAWQMTLFTWFVFCFCASLSEHVNASCTQRNSHQFLTCNESWCLGLRFKVVLVGPESGLDETVVFLTGYVFRRKTFYHLCLDYCVYSACFSRPVYVFFCCCFKPCCSWVTSRFEGFRCQTVLHPACVRVTFLAAFPQTQRKSAESLHLPRE